MSVLVLDFFTNGPFFPFTEFFVYFFFHIFLIAELEPVVA